MLTTSALSLSVCCPSLQLAEDATRNLHALKNVAEDATLPYDFLFGFVRDWEVDLPVLILSRTAALVQGDVKLPLAAESAAALGAPAALPPLAAVPPAVLERMRTYLAAARDLPWTMSAEVEAVIRGDIMASMAADRARFTVQQAHTLMTLARLASVSFGETSITPERWAWVKALEAARAARLQSATAGVAKVAAAAATATGTRAPGGSPSAQSSPARM